MYNFRETGSQYIHKITPDNFDILALELFHYQYQHNTIYRQYVDLLKVNPTHIKDITDIPFLPISFFKTHTVSSTINRHPAFSFESSGTTSETNSKHHVYNMSLYEQSLLRGFEEFYGKPKQYTFLALLPSYLERKNASLVHMAKVLMEHSNQPENGFYLDEWKKLQQVIEELEQAQKPTLLLGVTFALIDFATACPMRLKHTIIMETGGMKGRKVELTRTQVHEFLKAQFGVPTIHSEYGMTELLSQAYARQNGIFQCAATMKVLVRDINDPFEIKTKGSGCLNIIDLANVDSCAFIATEDLGLIHEDQSFEVLGRMDFAALRGCSLMTA